MSQLLIRQALEKAFKANFPGVPFAPENGSYTPEGGVPYAELSLLPAEPENPTMGDDFYREVGIFQVLLKFPSDVGVGAAAAQAEAIKTVFKRGSSFTKGLVTVRVQRTPAIAGGFDDDDRYNVPVSIRYFSNIG